jgi:hypothetical protein
MGTWSRSPGVKLPGRGLDLELYYYSNYFCIGPWPIRGCCAMRNYDYYYYVPFIFLFLRLPSN